MNASELRLAIADPAFPESAMTVLREVADLVAAGDSDPEARTEARDLVIRCLERRDELGDMSVILDSLVARVGLFPYLSDPDGLDLVDRLAYESHRPLVAPREDFVFHERQAHVYARLMDGETVILTAPTSFGKTLVVDALVASGQYANVVVVVPTIALIDEVRRRLSELNEAQELGFKVITHPGQAQGDRNMFVFTQERLLDEKNLPRLDLGVIDEFYKLRLERDPQRGVLLNLAFAKLRRNAKQLYLLGPNVGEVRELPADFEYRYMPIPDSTVAFDVIDVERSGDDQVDLTRVCAGLEEPTLIYVSSPRRAHEVAGWLVEARLGHGGLPAAAEWIARTYHPEWVLVRALEAGIGIHHGRLPRALAHYLVSAFNRGELRFLVCTQTLIEGVNTMAKNILIVDDTINRRKLDLFSFRNIQGRSGRMFKHFVGQVYLFNPAPQGELPSIDIPAITQPDDAPIEMLLGLEDQELTRTSQDRIAPYLDQDVLSPEVLRENAVDPDAQIALASTFHSDPSYWASQLYWRRFPKYEELQAVVQLIWEHFPGARQNRRWGAGSPEQLTLLVWRSYQREPLRELIEAQLRFFRERQIPRSVDEVVLDVLTFARNGLTFGVPKYLRVVNAIQEDVLGRYGLPVADYRAFAAAAEASFREPAALAYLDEYGVPPEIADRLRRGLARDAGLDEVLARLREVDIDAVATDPFERDLLEEARRGL